MASLEWQCSDRAKWIERAEILEAAYVDALQHVATGKVYDVCQYCTKRELICNDCNSTEDTLFKNFSFDIGAWIHNKTNS